MNAVYRVIDQVVAKNLLEIFEATIYQSGRRTLDVRQVSDLGKKLSFMARYGPSEERERFSDYLDKFKSLLGEAESKNYFERVSVSSLAITAEDIRRSLEEVAINPPDYYVGRTTYKIS